MGGRGAGADATGDSTRIVRSVEVSGSDAGFEAAAAVVERLWGERLGSQHPAPRPPKTQLQEWAQGRGLALPAYKQIAREGSEHEPVFLVEVKVGALTPAHGRGSTKREAESAAASLMLEQLSKA